MRTRWSFVLLGLLTGAYGWSAPLHIYAWREDTAKALPGTSAMIWSRMYYPAGKTPIGMPFHTAEPPEFAADELVRRLKHRAPDERAVLLDGAGICGGFNGEPAIFPGGDRSPESYADGGYPEFTASWMTAFWRRVHDAGVAPSFVILDYEGAPGFWGLKHDLARTPDVPPEIPDGMAGTVVAMQRLQKLFGGSPDGHAPTDYVHSGNGWGWNHTAVVDFSRWSDARRSVALRKAIFAPAWQQFGDQLPASNYDEQERAWTGRDLNNWPREPSSIGGNWSSPSLYLGAGGQRYRVFNGGRSPQYQRALRWLDLRNDVRSALARTPNVAPWYSQPDYGRATGQDVLEHRLQWAAGLLHDRSIGVSVMLFWADRAWTAEELAFARPIITYLHQMESARPEHISQLPESDAEAELQRWMRIARGISDGH
jgi:hypothetical protein